MEIVEKLFRLESEEELRVEVDSGKTDKVTVELKSGHAEIFGTELVINTKYQFGSGSKFAIFTYQVEFFRKVFYREIMFLFHKWICLTIHCHLIEIYLVELIR